MRTAHFALRELLGGEIGSNSMGCFQGDHVTPTNK